MPSLNGELSSEARLRGSSRHVFHRKAELEFSDIPMSGESAASAATTHTFFFLFTKGREKVQGEKRRKTITATSLF
jgi:hypothetical protein